jgi:hypothetical protein
MIEQLRKAIAEITKKARSAPDSNDAMRFSQAACNLANALATLKHSAED